jgi:hypothetical protein
MYDGIADALSHGNHDIAIHVVVDFKRFFSIVYKTFNYLNVLNQRWNRNFYGFHHINTTGNVFISLFS